MAEIKPCINFQVINFTRFGVCVGECTCVTFMPMFLYAFINKIVKMAIS